MKGLVFAVIVCALIVRSDAYAWHATSRPLRRAVTAFAATAPPPFDVSKYTQSMIGEEIPLSSEVTELPNTFEDAVGRAVARSLDCIASGQTRIRVDFDTSIGDITYTSLKNTLPMMKEFSIALTKELGLTMTVDVPAATAAEDTPTPDAEPLKTMRVFFPDMGAAALARRDWKLGTEVAEVPPSVRTANMQNDPIEPSDKVPSPPLPLSLGLSITHNPSPGASPSLTQVAVLLCPQSSETDFVKRIMESCTAANVPLVMINPNLVNMDQGWVYILSWVGEGLIVKDPGALVC